MGGGLSYQGTNAQSSPVKASHSGRIASATASGSSATRCLSRHPPVQGGANQALLPHLHGLHRFADAGALPREAGEVSSRALLRTLNAATATNRPLRGHPPHDVRTHATAARRSQHGPHPAGLQPRRGALDSSRCSGGGRQAGRHLPRRVPQGEDTRVLRGRAWATHSLLAAGGREEIDGPLHPSVPADR